MSKSTSKLGGRKGSNDERSNRKGSNEQRSTKGNTKEHLRKGTNASMQSSRTGRSAGSKATEDDDSTDTEVDLDAVPAHLRKAVPLHLVEARILKKNEKDRTNTPTSPGGTPKPGRRVGLIAGEEDEEVYVDPDPPPVLEVYVDKVLLGLGIALFLAWVLTIIPMLIVHVYIFYEYLADDIHRDNAEAVLLKLEADLVKELIPALSAIQMVVLQARAGLFNNSQPYHAVTRSVSSNIKESKRLLHVRIVNAAEKMVMVRPGNLHYVAKDEDGDGYIDVLIAPEDMMAMAEVLDDTACEGQDPFFCFEVEPGSWNLVQEPESEMDISWVGPLLLTIDKTGKPLNSTQWPLVARLMAHANVSAPGVSTKVLGVDVAMDLESVSQKIEDSTPKNGHIFLFSTTGEILAGTNWTASVAANAQTGDIQYQKIWELPLEWAQEITEKKLEPKERSMFWTGERDLVVMKAMGMDANEEADTDDESEESTAAHSNTTSTKRKHLLVEASRASFRTVVMMPRQTAVRLMFSMAVDAGIGISVAPIVGAIIAFILWAVVDVLRWCRAGCPCKCCRCCRRKEEEFAWQLELEED